MNARQIRKIARENISAHWVPGSIIAAAIACLLGGLLTGSNFLPELELELEELNTHDLYDLIGTLHLQPLLAFVGLMGIVSFLIGGMIQLGYAQYLLKQCRGQEPEIRDLFSQFDRFGTGFLQSFLRNLYTFLWFLLLIIPGIIALYSYAMTPFILADNPDMGANEAIKASKEMMDGHKLELFWLNLTFFGWSLLCALTLNIGYLFLNPYTNAAYAVFYCQLKAEASGWES